SAEAASRISFYGITSIARTLLTGNQCASSWDDVVPEEADRRYHYDNAEALRTIARIDSFTPRTCTCRCKLIRNGRSGDGSARCVSPAPRGDLAHALLQFVRQQRGHRQRRDALAGGPHAVEAQCQVPAPDAGTGRLRELCRVGQHEDSEDDVGLPQVAPQLAGRLSALDQPLDQRGVVLPGDRDQVPAVGGEHQDLPQP